MFPNKSGIGSSKLSFTESFDQPTGNDLCNNQPHFNQKDQENDVMTAPTKVNPFSSKDASLHGIFRQQNVFGSFSNTTSLFTQNVNSSNLVISNRRRTLGSNLNINDFLKKEPITDKNFSSKSISRRGEPRSTPIIKHLHSSVPTVTSQSSFFHNHFSFDNVIRFVPTTSTDFVYTNGLPCSTNVQFQSISVMPEYAHKSFEELRFEDYYRNTKAPDLGVPTSFDKKLFIFGSNKEAENWKSKSFNGPIAWDSRTEESGFGSNNNSPFRSTNAIICTSTGPFGPHCSQSPAVNTQPPVDLAIQDNTSPNNILKKYSFDLPSKIPEDTAGKSTEFNFREENTLLKEMILDKERIILLLQDKIKFLEEKISHSFDNISIDSTKEHIISEQTNDLEKIKSSKETSHIVERVRNETLTALINGVHNIWKKEKLEDLCLKTDP